MQVFGSEWMSTRRLHCTIVPSWREKLTTSTLYSSCETLQACQRACWLFLWVQNDLKNILFTQVQSFNRQSWFLETCWE